MPQKLQTNWGEMPVDEVFLSLHTSVSGLTLDEVKNRQAQYGKNILARKKTNLLVIFFRQFTSNPLIIILAIATCISYLLGQHVSSYYIFGIIMVSIFLGLFNEYAAEKTVETLLKRVSSITDVIRHGLPQEIPTSEVTVGDVVVLTEGSIVPADARIIEVKDLEMNEASLTGESVAVYKSLNSQKDIVNSTTVFMGTSVVSGWAKAVVTDIGSNTVFGKIAKEVTFVKPITEFQKGLMQFGNLIVKVIIIMTIAIFAINALLGHSLLESLLFSLAIAVGLTPELLPVIVTISLSHGAGKLAKKHVIAKQLIAIENLGNMDVLCTDKTGTLTEGIIRLVDYKNAEEKADTGIVEIALQGVDKESKKKVNAIDEAILAYAKFHSIAATDTILDREPFNYEKKALYFVRHTQKRTELVVRGAPEVVLSLCKHKDQEKLQKTFRDLNMQGIRVIALASKEVTKKQEYTWDDAKELSYQGYLGFVDTPKTTVKEALHKLHKLHVEVKILTGDNELVTKKICEEVGVEVEGILTGPEIAELTDDKLEAVVESTTIFARLSPTQKLQVIKALREKGHAVGFLGDGVNDLPALHGADVGLSVNTSTEVAKDAASVVLLRRSLEVIAEGVIEGRKTFQNTIKYILMATSSNFGNMFSAAGASFILPFLPMTPVQILLTNGMYDLSQTTIPSDTVDPESLVKPRQWNIKFLNKYMLFFGPISSLFDFATFGIMFFIFHANEKLFQTGWFVESIATEILVIFVIRTARTPFFKSRPSVPLLLAALSIVCIGIILPFSPLAADLGFVALPPLYFIVLLLLIGTYLTIVEFVKNFFLKKYSL